MTMTTDPDCDPKIVADDFRPGGGASYVFNNSLVFEFAALCRNRLILLEERGTLSFCRFEVKAQVVRQCFDPFGEDRIDRKVVVIGDIMAPNAQGLPRSVHREFFEPDFNTVPFFNLIRRLSVTLGGREAYLEKRWERLYRRIRSADEAARIQLGLPVPPALAAEREADALGQALSEAPPRQKRASARL